MTTNRMGLEQTLSDGELTVITETDHAQCGDAATMARELLAYRKASREPVAWTSQRSIDTKCKVVAFTDDISAMEYGIANGWDDIIELYAASPLQAVPVPDGWINCGERMPENGEHIIIFCDGAFVLSAQFRDGEFYDVVRDGDEFFETASRCVTHWMPRPAAPSY